MGKKREENLADLRRVRQNALARVKNLVNALARPSGYRKNIRPEQNGNGLTSETVMLFCRKDRKPMKINSPTIGELSAITTDGPHDDAYGGGATMMPWKMVSTDDLLRLEGYLLKHWDAFE